MWMIGALLLTNDLDLDPEYRDLLHALIDDEPGAQGALADFHDRRTDKADRERTIQNGRRPERSLRNAIHYVPTAVHDFEVDNASFPGHNVRRTRCVSPHPLPEL